jgi:hypothetical protein
MRFLTLKKITSHILNHNFILQNFDHSCWKDEILVYFYPNRYILISYTCSHTHTYEVYETMFKKISTWNFFCKNKDLRKDIVFLLIYYWT